MVSQIPICEFGLSVLGSTSSRGRQAKLMRLCKGLLGMNMQLKLIQAVKLSTFVGRVGTEICFSSGWLLAAPARVPGAGNIHPATKRLMGYSQFHGR